MALVATAKHSLGDLLEGQVAYSVADSSATTVPIYYVSTKKSGSNVIALFFDVRTSENPNRTYQGASKAYLTNLNIPAAFVNLMTDSSGVQTPNGSGLVTIAAATMASLGVSGTTDATVVSVTGSNGDYVAPSVQPSAPTPSVVPTPAGGTPPTPSPAPTPVPTPAGLGASGLFGMSTVTTVIVGVVLAIAGYFGWKEYSKKGKK